VRGTRDHGERDRPRRVPDPAGYNQFILDQQAVKRRGEPADIANAVLFLAAPESSFITGQLLCVDGGWVMH
jgi:NAD(P)-dependent dehydrogenase (short-subunit alcohol dehydrogenase family)